MVTAVKYLGSAGLTDQFTIDELSGNPPSFGGKNLNVPNASYFDVQVNSGILAGWYDGWCIDFQGDTFFGRTDLNVQAFSGYTDTDEIPEVSQADNFPLLNWFFNNLVEVNVDEYSISFTNDVDGDGISTYTFNYGEAQRFIWLLMDGQGGSATYPDVTADGPVNTVKVANMITSINNESAAQNFEPDSIDDTIALVLKPEENSLQETLINVQLAQLGDFVWQDTNANGIQDNGENGIAGVTVNLLADVDRDGTIEAGEIVATAITDGNGEYLFLLTPGEYKVQFIAPNGYAASAANQENDDTKDSDANPITGITELIELSPGESDLSIDAGFFFPPFTSFVGKIGDRIWFDNNGDGVQDNGEGGINGVTVKLFDKGNDLQDPSDDVLLETTVTTGDGVYLFDSIPQGNYTVMVDPISLPDNVVQTGDPDNVLDDMSMVNFDGGENFEQDFGYQPLGRIGDRLWFDNNGDGVQDSGEVGINGVTVQLINKDTGEVITTDVTEGDGQYLFENLPQGNYTIAVDTNTLPANVQQTGDPDANLDDMSMVNLPAGAENLDQDFGYEPLDGGEGTIGDRLWFDNNGDGVQNSGEAGINGVTVQLINKDTGEVITTDVTEGDGQYLFSNLPQGNYTIAVDTSTLPANVQQTGDPDGNLDSMSMVNLPFLGNNLDQDFGYQPLGRIGDRLWFDNNGDGVQDSGEAGINDVTVQLFDKKDPNNPDDDILLKTTVTSGDGDYLFSDLPEGNYKIVVDVNSLPNNVQQTGDPDSNLDNMSMVDLPAGDQNLDQDFGYQFETQPAIVIEKFVRVDDNPIAIRKLVAVEPIGGAEEGQAVCQTEGKPLVMVFEYNPSTTFDTMQPEGKGGINPGSNVLDDDDNIFVVITDKSGATTSDEALTGETYFSGNVKIGEQFTASAADGSFNNNVEFYFFDEEGGPLLQSAYYHASCSAPIILGDGILSATLVGYEGVDGDSMVSLPQPEFLDANDSPGPEAIAGTNVEYLIEVTNTGLDPISDVVVSDNNKTPDDPSNDFKPAPILEGDQGIYHNVGDINEDGLLDPGEVWLYSFSEETESGQHTNKATATGRTAEGQLTMAMDTANYTGIGSSQANYTGIDGSSDCPTGPIGEIDLGNLTKYLFFFANGSTDANWQGATKGFVGDVAVDGLQANERTSGGVPYAGTIYTNDSTLGAWQDIVDQNSGQATTVTGQETLIAGLEADLMNAFTQINALTATSGFASVSSTSLDGLNTQNNTAETFVINITSGLNFSSQINITGDAEDVFVLRWDTDADPNNGYQGQVKPQSGGAIVPLGGLTAGNFINVAGDINASGGGSNPSNPYPQGPYYDNGTGALINGGSDFSGGGFFTGYWLTTGDPSNGDTASLSNAIFVGGWYTLSDKFSMTSGTSGVHVCPNPATQPDPHSPVPDLGSENNNGIILKTDDPFDPNKIGEDANDQPGVLAQLDDRVTFTYKVTNTGNVVLDITKLVDDNATFVNPDDDFIPQEVLKENGNNFGDTNNNGNFDPGEMWYFQAVEFSPRPGQNTNIAKVKAVDPNGVMVMDEDPANYLVNPLVLEKLVGVGPIGDGVEGKALCETEGKPEAMIFEYNPRLTFDTLQPDGKGGIVVNIGLDDDPNGFFVVTNVSDATTSADALSGDTYFSGNIEVGERFTAVGVNGSFNSNMYIYLFDEENGQLLQQAQYHTSCSAPILMGDGILSATLVGYDGENGGMIMLPEPESNFVDADVAPGPEALMGSQVDFRYEVSNIGDAPLSNVEVSDNMVTPEAVIDENGFNIGDTNMDNLLDVDEIWIYSASEVAQKGLHTNKGTATAKLGETVVEAMDMGNYTGVNNPIPEGHVCEALGKPVSLTFTYTPGTEVITGGDGNNQDGKAKVSGTPDSDGSSYFVVSNSNNIADIKDGSKKTYFAGNVAEGHSLLASLDFTGADKFESNTYILVFNDEQAFLNGDNPLQTMEYHTSCSQPIEINDIVGSVELVEYSGELGSYDNLEIDPLMGEVNSGFNLAGLFGKPQALTFKYHNGDTLLTGGKNYNQDGNAEILVNHGIDHDGTSHIIVTDEDKPHEALNGKGKQFFVGNVSFDSLFEASIINAQTDKFEDKTYIHYFEDSTGGLLRSVEYRTKGDQPISLEDELSGVTLLGYMGETASVGLMV